MRRRIGSFCVALLLLSLFIPLVAKDMARDRGAVLAGGETGNGGPHAGTETGNG